MGSAAVVVRCESREAWLRRRRIGSSDVSTVLGVPPPGRARPYGSPYALRERLLGEADAADLEGELTPAMERGIRLEPKVLRAYALRTGAELLPSRPHTLYAREEWATVTPDALTRSGLVVEAKTDRHPDRWGPSGETIERWEPAAAEIVRPDYYLQVALQMWVLDAPAADLAVLVPDLGDPFAPELRIYHLVRDREVEAALVERLRGWWDRHVVHREPVEWDGSPAATRALAALERRAKKRATPADLALVAEYQAASRAYREAKARRDELGQALVAAAGETTGILLPRGSVAIIRTRGRLELDEDGLLAEHPELRPVLEKHRKRGNPSIYPRIFGAGE